MRGAFDGLRKPGLTGAEEKAALRVFVAARYAETPEEAREALASWPVLPVDQEALLNRPSSRVERFDFGHLLLLAGRTEEALPLLEKAGRSCSVIAVQPVRHRHVVAGFARATGAGAGAGDAQG